MSYKDTGREPAPVIGSLGSLYETIGALHWPLFRATVGGVLFTHGWPKLMMGFQAVAANTLMRAQLDLLTALGRFPQ